MVIFVKRESSFLFPVDESSETLLNTLRDDREYKIKVSTQRNPAFHRKFFALLRLVFDNQDKYSEFEDFRVEVELKCGNYREHITTKGEIIYVPKSISFDKMDETEFSDLYNKAIDVILRDFIPDDTFESELEMKGLGRDILNFI